jgi:hypothetical protein
MSITVMETMLLFERYVGQCTTFTKYRVPAVLFESYIRIEEKIKEFLLNTLLTDHCAHL